MVIGDLENKALIVNGQIRCTRQSPLRKPEEIDYTAYGIHNALIIDNTGAFTKRPDLERHLKARVGQGAAHGPGKEVPNIVHGINHKDRTSRTKGLQRSQLHHQRHQPCAEGPGGPDRHREGHIETVHAYTNDQNLLDNFHKKPAGVAVPPSTW